MAARRHRPRGRGPGAPGALRLGFSRRWPASRLGTANRIVPLGDSYLELVAVVDQAAAVDSSFGRWVASRASRPGRRFGWAMRTSELDTIARRLDLTVHSGERVAPSGEVLRWRSAGMDKAAAEPSLPFFIEWAAGVRLPGGTAVTHPAAPAAISKLYLEGDPDRLAAWLGNHALPIVVRTGRPAVTAIVLATATGEIVLDAKQP
jgi:Glyoxalase-like domain